MDYFTLVPVDEIIVKNRYRKDLDVDSMAESIKKHGLLQPIGITHEKRLVFGERRLRAYQQLGYPMIACLVDERNALVEEMIENTERKPFTLSELVEIGRDIEAQAHAYNRNRMAAAGRGDKPSDNVPTLTTRDIVNQNLPQISSKTFERARAVVEAAEEDPDKYSGLVEQMDRTGNAAPAFKQLKKKVDEDRVLNLTPVEGKFHTILLDPPWKFDWLSESGQAGPGYAMMTLDEIEDIQPGRWAMDDFCHLYVWVPNNFMREACRLIELWGFDHRSVLTWDKGTFGMGHYFRNTTEHVLFATRGKKTTRADDIPTLFTGKPATDDHSSKPEELREIIEKASYPPFAEGFPRTERDNWTNLYEEIAGELPAKKESA